MKRFLSVAILVFTSSLFLSSQAVTQNKVVVIPLFGDATGPPAPVQKSGQTKCYDADGDEINCSGTGQDGNYQKGITWPNPHFTDNGNGTVTDNLTGLVWLKNANCACFYSGDSTGQNPRNWTDSLTAANSLATGDCGLTDGSAAGDWRLPNVNELQSLMHYGFWAPALPNTAGTGQWTSGDPFIDVQSVYYWTSTSYLGSPPGIAWCVGIHSGTIDAHNIYKSTPNNVWPVRDGN
jgi:hypothetical protein